MTQKPAQCGRTFTHRPHDTDAGPSVGLDATTVPTARRQQAIRDARDAAAQRTLEASRG